MSDDLNISALRADRAPISEIGSVGECDELIKRFDKECNDLKAKVARMRLALAPGDPDPEELRMALDALNHLAPVLSSLRRRRDELEGKPL